MTKFSFCPQCAGPLEFVSELLTCSKCSYRHYDNPIPVAVTLIPIWEPWSLPKLGEFQDSSLVLVRRKNPPFVGEWCLPGGYINKHEHPKAAACREAKEETGLEVRLEKILCLCNPMPGEVNQIIISYLGRRVGGELKAGDDAMDAKAFRQKDLPKICFRSHRMLVDKWFKGELGEITGTDLEI